MCKIGIVFKTSCDSRDLAGENSARETRFSRDPNQRRDRTNISDLLVNPGQDGCPKIENTRSNEGESLLLLTMLGDHA